MTATATSTMKPGSPLASLYGHFISFAEKWRIALPPLHPPLHRIPVHHLRLGPHP